MIWIFILLLLPLPGLADEGKPGAAPPLDFDVGAPSAVEPPPSSMLPAEESAATELSEDEEGYGSTVAISAVTAGAVLGVDRVVVPRVVGALQPVMRYLPSILVSVLSFMARREEHPEEEGETADPEALERRLSVFAEELKYQLKLSVEEQHRAQLNGFAQTRQHTEEQLKLLQGAAENAVKKAQLDAIEALQQVLARNAAAVDAVALSTENRKISQQLEVLIMYQRQSNHG